MWYKMILSEKAGGQSEGMTVGACGVSGSPGGLAPPGGGGSLDLSR